MGEEGKEKIGLKMDKKHSLMMRKDETKVTRKVNKEQLSLQFSTDRLIVSCCNRLASQSITRGDGGHSA